jgi:hypothetical protein
VPAISDDAIATFQGASTVRVGGIGVYDRSLANGNECATQPFFSSNAHSMS